MRSLSLLVLLSLSPRHLVGQRLEENIANLQKSVEQAEREGDIEKAHESWLSVGRELKAACPNLRVRVGGGHDEDVLDLSDPTSIGLLWANNYHPHVQFVDLNGDALQECVLSFLDHSVRGTSYVVAILVNSPKGFSFGIRVQGYIHRGVWGRPPYALLGEQRSYTGGRVKLLLVSSKIDDRKWKEKNPHQIAFTDHLRVLSLDSDGKFSETELWP